MTKQFFDTPSKPFTGKDWRLSVLGRLTDFIHEASDMEEFSKNANNESFYLWFDGYSEPRKKIMHKLKSFSKEEFEILDEFDVAMTKWYEYFSEIEFKGFQKKFYGEPWQEISTITNRFLSLSAVQQDLKKLEKK